MRRALAVLALLALGALGGASLATGVGDQLLAASLARAAADELGEALDRRRFSEVPGLLDRWTLGARVVGVEWQDDAGRTQQRAGPPLGVRRAWEGRGVHAVEATPGGPPARRVAAASMGERGVLYLGVPDRRPPSPKAAGPAIVLLLLALWGLGTRPAPLDPADVEATSP